MKGFIIFLVCCFFCVSVAEVKAEWWGVGNDGTISFNIQADENSNPWDIVFGGNEQMYYAGVNYRFTFDLNLIYIPSGLENIWGRITLENANGVCFDTGRTTVSSGENPFIFSPPEDGEYYLTVQLGYEENNGVNCTFSAMNVTETDEESPYDESFSGWYVSSGNIDLYNKKISVASIVSYDSPGDTIITKDVNIEVGRYRLRFDLENVEILWANICFQEAEYPWEVISAFSTDTLLAGSNEIILTSGRELSNIQLKIQLGYPENENKEPCFLNLELTKIEEDEGTYESGYQEGIQYCIDNPALCGLRPAKPDFTGDLPGSVQSYLILTENSVPFNLPPGSYVEVFGSEGANTINVEKYSRVDYTNSIGENIVNIEEASSEFTVYRSGATIYLNSNSGTQIKIAATETPQSFRFANGSLILSIIEGNVMFGEQLVDETTSSLTATPTEGDSLSSF